jgi:hypothetical protein
MSSRSRSNHSQCHINFSTCGCTLVGVPKPNPEGSNECAITRCQGLLSESYRDVRSLVWGVLLREREPARWRKMTSTRVSNQDGAWGKGRFSHRSGKAVLGSRRDCYRLASLLNCRVHQCEASDCRYGGFASLLASQNTSQEPNLPLGQNSIVELHQWRRQYLSGIQGGRQWIFKTPPSSLPLATVLRLCGN